MTAKTIQEIKELAKYAVKGVVPTEFANNATKEDVNNAFAEQLNLLAKDKITFMRNAPDIYEILQEAYDEIIPKRVEDVFGMFAEIRQVANGQKVQFKLKKGRRRAKRFITKAAVSGNYEAFRLDTDVFEVGAYSIGGAAYLDFERMSRGEESLAESSQLLMEGIEEAVTKEVHKALRASFLDTRRPAANKVDASDFDVKAMQKLVATVKSYGTGAIIFATPEFIMEMGDSLTYIAGKPSDTDIEDLRNYGLVRMFYGTPVVALPQSFIDEKNVNTQLDPQIAYVFPTGGEKVVKITMEGNTQVDSFTNRDRSVELQAYKKFGVAILEVHNWGIYRNKGITQTYDGESLGA